MSHLSTTEVGGLYPRAHRAAVAMIAATMVSLGWAADANADHGLPLGANYGVTDAHAPGVDAPAFPGPKAFWFGTCDLQDPSTSENGVGIAPAVARTSSTSGSPMPPRMRSTRIRRVRRLGGRAASLRGGSTMSPRLGLIRTSRCRSGCSARRIRRSTAAATTRSAATATPRTRSCGCLPGSLAIRMLSRPARRSFCVARRRCAVRSPRSGSLRSRWAAVE